MLSIFIWKTDKDEEKKDTTFSMVKYDRGADWFSDPTGSYELIAIEHVTDTRERSVLCYRAKAVSYDKVGSDLLECLEIPFRCRKMSNGDENGDGDRDGQKRERWDALGQWERCMVMDTGKDIDAQWQDAQEWMAGGKVPGRDVAYSPLPPFAPVTGGIDAHCGGRGSSRDYGSSRGQGRGRGRGRGRGQGRGRGKYSG